jgi:hypothetical protein
VAYFHKIKGRELVSRLHNDLNTIDDNAELTENFSQHRCIMHRWEFKMFDFEIPFDLL